MSSLGYRKEIDGLRSLAVISVILFHAGFDFFEGGFVGVDVFFVISGYLITSIILDQKESGTFSLFDFYERRARRLIPALLFMLVATSAAAFFVLIPTDLKDFSQSLVSTLFFIANLFFWYKSGYFDTSSDFKPLLHTWSLSVEEQYYLLFPVIFIFIWKFLKKYILEIVLLLTFASFVTSQIFVVKNPEFSFFFVITRFWEISSGGILALFSMRVKSLNLGPIRDNIISLFGLLLILVSIFTFDKNTPFPGAYALIPVIGTLLIIGFAKNKNICSIILSNKYLVFLGVISYSTYLWHQPLFSFSRHLATGEISILVKIILIFMSLVMGYFSYRFIETPFRKKEFLSPFATAATGIFLSLLLLFFGILGHFSNGFHGRKAADQLPSDFYKFSYIDKAEKSSECVNSPKYYCNLRVNTRNDGKILLVGDSHSHDLQKYFIRDAEDRGFSADQFTITGPCGFVLSKNFGCIDKINALKSLVEIGKYKEIVFVNSFYGYFKSGIDDEELLRFKDLIRSMSSASGDVFIFSSRYHIGSSRPVANIVMNAIEYNDIKYFGSEADIDRFYLEINFDNVHIYNQSGFIRKIDSGDVFFKGLSYDGYPIYRDSNHLTKYGAEKVYQDFVNFRNKILESR